MTRTALMTACVALAISSPASAFGLRSHLWIAEQVHADLAGDCALEIRGHSFAIAQHTCAAIVANKGAFLSGALGPDAFPDLLAGQTIIHPGIEGDLQANHWIERLLSAARTDEEIAFSWGYVMHYAGDSFAHSYVNNYSGDVFDLLKGGRPNVERRHFLLEKYIDQRLPYSVDWRSLKVPEVFLAQQLVLTPHVSNNKRPPRGGLHLYALRSALDAARKADREAPDEANRAKEDMSVAYADLIRLEEHLGVPSSAGAPYDRRAEAIRQLSKSQRKQLDAAHERYRHSAVTAANQLAFAVFAKEWASDIEKIAEHYITSSLRFSQTMVRQALGEPIPYAERDTLRPYREWYRCYAPVVMGEPVGAGEELCERLQRLGTRLDTRDAALRSLLQGRARAAYVAATQMNRWLKGVMERAALDLIAMSTSDLLRLVREIIDPATVDSATLNEAFFTGPNGQLEFKCVVDWIDADLQLRPPPSGYANRDCDNVPRSAAMDPWKFKPLEYAVVLAKASLLDQAGVRELTRRFGGDPDELRMGGHSPYSMLIDSVRSIDGSQQWQTESMPPPRRARYSGRPRVERAGWGKPGEPFPGFPLYRTHQLRAGPFRTLFPDPFEGSILYRAEMQPPHYPFVPCPGDPLRPPGGTIQIGDC